MAKKTMMTVPINSNLTNEQIVAVTLTVLKGRPGFVGEFECYCNFTSFDNDKRDVWEIPECRALCRRLVNLGFISCLSYLNLKRGRGAWGAFDVWLCAEGLMRRETKITPPIKAAFLKALDKANAVADAALSEG